MMWALVMFHSGKAEGLGSVYFNTHFSDPYSAEPENRYIISLYEYDLQFPQ